MTEQIKIRRKENCNDQRVYIRPEGRQELAGGWDRCWTF